MLAHCYWNFCPLEEIIIIIIFIILSHPWYENNVEQLRERSIIDLTLKRQNLPCFSLVTFQTQAVSIGARRPHI